MFHWTHLLIAYVGDIVLHPIVSRVQQMGHMTHPTGLDSRLWSNFTSFVAVFRSFECPKHS